MKKNIIFYVHWITAGVMEIAIVVSVFLDIIPLLTLITTSKNDTAVVEYSCVNLMFGCVRLAFSRKVSKVSIQSGQI